MLLGNRDKMKISVVINTYNAGRFLERVLQSACQFDEIVVCDMHSTDKTVEIAEKYNCTVVYYPKEPLVEPARNFAIQAAAHEWVLVVDADEIIPEALRLFLYAQIERPDCPAGIKIPRKNYFMGRFMHATYPDFLLRFLKKEGAVWPPFVHAEPKVAGPCKSISSKRKELAFIHLANDSIETFLNKTNVYTNDERKKREGQKHGLLSLFFSPAFRFFKFYVLKGGFRDGRAGLICALMNAMYKFVTIAKLWESKLNENDIDKELKA